ncbi:MAG TPA: hypothetical protein GX507_09290 [Clostridia bacterium]|nr:hypothetical protein [Clostridia bacterium]
MGLGKFAHDILVGCFTRCSGAGEGGSAEEASGCEVQDAPASGLGKIGEERVGALTSPSRTGVIVSGASPFRKTMGSPCTG